MKHCEIVFEIPSFDCEQTLKMKSGIETLAHDVKNIDITLVHGEYPWPRIVVNDHVSFLTVPNGKFRDWITDLLHATDGALDSSATAMMKNLERPVHVKMYVTSFCPFCQSVFNELKPVLGSDIPIHFEIIDGELFPDLAVKDGVKSAPTVIFDGRYRWTGDFKRDDFIAMITASEDDLIERLQIKLIESGEAVYLADRMVGSGKIFPSYYSILTHEKWPVRLGGMVAAERIYEIDQELAAQVVNELWSRYDECDETVRGDILYLTGEIGEKRYETILCSIIDGNQSQAIRESAEDALSVLAQRFEVMDNTGDL